MVATLQQHIAFRLRQATAYTLAIVTPDGSPDRANISGGR
jgi:hypothetical protein